MNKIGNFLASPGTTMTKETLKSAIEQLNRIKAELEIIEPEKIAIPRYNMAPETYYRRHVICNMEN
jgi:hypothetical protein